MAYPLRRPKDRFAPFQGASISGLDGGFWCVNGLGSNLGQRRCFSVLRKRQWPIGDVLFGPRGEVSRADGTDRDPKSSRSVSIRLASSVPLSPCGGLFTLWRNRPKGLDFHRLEAGPEPSYDGFLTLRKEPTTLNRKTEKLSLRPPVYPQRILRPNEVVEMLGVSRTTLWRWERSGNLPPKLVLGPHSIGWLESDLAEWIAARKQAEPETEPAPSPGRRGPGRVK